jgi:hypothetical protein
MMMLKLIVACPLLLAMMTNTTAFRGHEPIVDD